MEDLLRTHHYLNDKGFESDRDAECVICNKPYAAGERIATAPGDYWLGPDGGPYQKFGHLVECVLKVRRANHPGWRG